MKLPFHLRLQLGAKFEIEDKSLPKWASRGLRRLLMRSPSAEAVSQRSAPLRLGADVSLTPSRGLEPQTGHLRFESSPSGYYLDSKDLLLLGSTLQRILMDVEVTELALSHLRDMTRDMARVGVTAGGPTGTARIKPFHEVFVGVLDAAPEVYANTVHNAEPEAGVSDVSSTLPPGLGLLGKIFDE